MFKGTLRKIPPPRLCAEDRRICLLSHTLNRPQRFQRDLGDSRALSKGRPRTKRQLVLPARRPCRNQNHTGSGYVRSTNSSLDGHFFYPPSVGKKGRCCNNSIAGEFATGPLIFSDECLTRPMIRTFSRSGDPTTTPRSVYPLVVVHVP